MTEVMFESKHRITTENREQIEQINCSFSFFIPCRMRLVVVYLIFIFLFSYSFAWLLSVFTFYLPGFLNGMNTKRRKCRLAIVCRSVAHTLCACPFIVCPPFSVCLLLAQPLCPLICHFTLCVYLAHYNYTPNTHVHQTHVQQNSMNTVHTHKHADTR